MRALHVSFLVLSVLLMSGLAGAGEPQLRIRSTEIDCDAGTLTLHGEFGDPATDAIIVTLDLGAGPIELAQVGTPTQNTVVVELPNNECAPAGTHRLRAGTVVGDDETVETTNSKVRPVQFFTVLDLALGATGPAGAPSALSGYEQVETAVKNPGSLGSGSVFSAVASCSSGKKVLGGGIRLSGTVAVLADLRVFESVPASTSSWRSAAILVGPTPAADAVTLQAYAICADAN